MSETALKGLVELRADLVAAHALDLEQDALLGVVVEQWLAVLLEFLEACTVRLLVVVRALGEGLSGDIVATGNAGPIESCVVYAAGRLVHPSAGDALENDGKRRLDGNDQVHGDDLLEGDGLGDGSGIAVQHEGRRRILGSLWNGVLIEMERH